MPPFLHWIGDRHVGTASGSTLARPAPALQFACGSLAKLLQRGTLRGEPSSFPPTHRPAVLFAAVWLLTLVGLTLLPSSTTRLMTWPFAAIVWLWWLVPVVIVFARWRRLPPLDPPLAAAGAALLLAGGASATLAPLAQLLAPHLWPVAGFAAMLLLAAGPSPIREALPRIVPVMAAVLSCVSLVGLLLTHGHLASIWQTRNDYPFGHSVTTAGALLIGLPWLVLSLVTARRPLPRLVWSITLLIALVALAATSSRAAVGVAGGGVVAATAWAVRSAPWSRFRKVLIAAIALGLVAAGILSNERLRDLVLHRQWSGIAAASNDQRLAMIEAGGLLWQRHPWTGYGPGSVPYAYPLVRTQLGSTIDSVLQLHSTPIHYAATLGLAGSVAALLGLTWFLLACRRLYSFPGDTGDGRFVRIAAAFSLGLYGLFALTDYQLDQPWLAAFLAFNASILARPRPLKSRMVGPPALVVALLSFAALALALPRTVRDLRARQVYDRALASSSESAALDGFAAAAAVNPWDPYYRHQEASLAFQLSLNAADAATRNTLRQRARQALEATLQAGPPPEYATLNLGWMDLEDGRPGAALQMFQAARLFAPNRQDLLLGTALAENALGRTDAAAHTLAIALLHDPTDVATPLWSDPSARRLRDLARAWLATRTRSLAALHPDIAARLERIEFIADRFDRRDPAAPTSPPFVRRRDGYPVLAYHPDGPAPVDFQIVVPPPLDLGLPASAQPGINLGLPAPVLIHLLENPPPPDAEK